MRARPRGAAGATLAAARTPLEMQQVVARDGGRAGRDSLLFGVGAAVVDAVAVSVRKS